MAGRAKRRARGTGSIFRVGGRWVGRVRRNGVSREVSAATQAEVVAKLAALGPPSRATTVAAWCDKWLAGLSVRPTTYANYECNVRNHVKPVLGTVPVAALTPYRCEEALKRWAAMLDPNTARLVADQFSSCLRAAVRAGLRPDNPMAAARKPKRVQRPPPPPDAIALLIRKAACDPAAWPLVLVAATGCRVGEAIALDVPDFDPVGGTVSVTKTWARRGGKYAAGPPKSANGVRTLRVPRVAVPVLLAARGGREEGPLFLSPTSAGERIDVQQVRRRCVQLCGRNPHALRHGVATALVSAGTPLGDVARFLGDSVGTIVNTYLHPSGQDPAETLERLFAEAVGRPKGGRGPA